MSDNITGVVLAGGRARRMQERDKGLLPVAGRPLVSWTIDKLKPQTGAPLINANRNAEQYSVFGEVIADIHSGYCGPLAGIHAGLCAAKTEWALFVPCDSPFLPDNLAQTLFAAAGDENVELVVAVSGGRAQPVFMLAKTKLAQHLDDFINGGGRKIDLWYPQTSHATATFADADCFININTPEDLEAAATRLRA